MNCILFYTPIFFFTLHIKFTLKCTLRFHRTSNGSFTFKSVSPHLARNEHFAAMDTPYCCSFQSHNSPERQEILPWLMVAHTHCPDPSIQTDLVLSHAPAHTNAGGEGGERKYNKPRSKQ